MKHARNDYSRIQDPAGKIPADEPVFLLRGQDIWAAPTVAYYAMVLERAATQRTGQEALDLLELAHLSRVQAMAMMDWPKHKQPDPEKPTAAPTTADIIDLRGMLGSQS